VGHTQYDLQNNVGYVFFPCPGSNISNVEAVKIAEFGGWLGEADTRLVFLSSCASASQDFIYQLAKQHVPAIIGFLWEVADAPAREYATSFYQLLLEGREHSLESACLAAKKKMYRRYSNNPIWASSVLVMQTSV
jgi:CHAT domain-containing protein